MSPPFSLLSITERQGWSKLNSHTIIPAIRLSHDGDFVFKHVRTNVMCGKQSQRITTIFKKVIFISFSSEVPLDFHCW